MASDEVCCGDEVRRADGGLAKAEMALGQTAGFFGVIDEISLAVEVRGISYETKKGGNCAVLLTTSIADGE